MTPIVMPMDAWVLKQTAADETALMDEGPDQT
jgi:hypothetical protein